MWAPTVSLFRWLLFVDHVDLTAESTKAVDEGEAREENHPEPAKPAQRMPMLRGVRALTDRLRGEADIAGK